MRLILQLGSNAEPGCGFSNKRGEINFYGGIVQGNTIFGVGGIANIRKGYQIKQENKSKIYEEEEYVLDSVSLEEFDEHNYVVKNEKTGIRYTNLEKAIEEVPYSDNTILTILNDFELKSNASIEKNKKIVIDLSGKCITNKYMNITNEGFLEIIDSIGEGLIDCERLSITNKNEFIMKGGKIKSSNSYKANHANISECTVLNNINEGIIKFNNGEIEANKTNQTGFSCGIENNDNAKVEIRGGEINCFTDDGECAYRNSKQ